MKNVRVLDCTLRDGGRIINCAFPDSEIKELSYKLSEANVDIIEVGFLRDWRNVEYKGNSTFFTDVDQIRPFIDKTRNNTMYVAFIDYGMFDFNSLKPYDGTSIDGIRYGFTKKNFLDNKEDVLRCVQIIKDKGYKLFVQGVNSLNYSDREILELVDMINEIHPYSFGIVDTYGAMYMDDVDRLYGLIDNNMDSDICVNFHSHNNYQLSFAFAQEVVKLSRGSRQVIIDATLSGMGKVAGNLNTELIVDYLVRKLHYDYDFDRILDIIDNYIYKYAVDHKWGYSIPAMMAGIYKSHPNNIIYLTEKFRLDTKDIGNILSMIDPQLRQRYDYDNIERLYIEYNAEKIDDTETINQFNKIIDGRTVLVLVPGNSLNKYRQEIDKYIEDTNPFVISVNFVADYQDSYAFYGNKKRYTMNKEKRQGRKIVVSSNIKTDDDAIVVNYHGLINRGYRFFENSTMMLLNFLKKANVKHISIAGFDGFEVGKNNYTDSSFQNERNKVNFVELNKEIRQMFNDYLETISGKCLVDFITPSQFDINRENNAK